MNPSRSRWTLLALSLCAVSPSRAAAELKAIYTGTQVFYAEGAAYEKLRKDMAGEVPLLTDGLKDGKRDKVESGAVAYCRPKSNPCEVAVVLDRGAQGRFVVPTQLHPPALQTQDRSMALPPGMSPAIWNVVVNSGMPPLSWPKAAAALKLLSTKDPATFRKLVSGGNFTYKDVLKSLEINVARGDNEEALAAHAKVETEKRVAAMPQSLNDGLGELQAPPRITGAPDVAPSHAVVERKDDPATGDLAVLEASYNELTGEAAQKRLKELILAFIKRPEGKNAFISADIQPDQREQSLKLLEGGIGRYVDAEAKSEEGRRKLSILSFMMEPEEKRSERKIFRGSLKPFTVGANVNFDPAKGEAGGPYKGDFGSPEGDVWLQAFLKFSAEKAVKAYNQGKTSDKQIGQAIANRENGNADGVAGQVGPVGNRRVLSPQGMIRDFSPKAMYEDGARVMVHNVPNEPGATPRILSFKIYTEYPKHGGPPRERLGIFDITNPNDRFGQYFDISKDGALDFRLDDRANHPGGVKYHLDIAGGNISLQPLSLSASGLFGGGAVTSSPFGQPFNTGITELYNLRQRQAQHDGYDMAMAGHRFKVLGQGGFYGSLIYFPTDASGKIISSTPAFEAVVSKLQGGRTVRTANEVGVGCVTEGKCFNVEYRDGAYHSKSVAKPTDQPERKDPLGAPEPPKAGTTGTTPAPTTGGATPGPKAGDAASSTDVKACSYGDKITGFDQLSKYDAGDDFSRYTEISKSGPNGTYLCVHGNMILFVPGLIAKGDITTDGQNLYVKTISLDAKGGSSFVPADELSGLEIAPGEPGKSNIAKFKGGTRGMTPQPEYIVRLDGLDTRIQDVGKKVPHLSDIRRVAWVSRQRDITGLPKNGWFKVYLIDGEDHLASMRTAIQQYGTMGGSFCFDKGKINPRVDEHLKKILNDGEFVKNVVPKDAAIVADDKAGIKAYAESLSVAFKCLITDPGATETTEIIEPAKTGSSNILTLGKWRGTRP